MCKSVISLLEVATSLRYFSCSSFLLTFIIIFSINVEAQKSSINETTAHHTYFFSKNISWPNEENLKHFTIALYKINDKSLIEEFRNLSKKSKVKNKEIKILTLDSLDNLSNTNVIFTTNNENIKNISEKINARPILLVTKDAKNNHNTMINLYKNQNQSIKFEINAINISKNNLVITPKLILLGGNEDDINKLFIENNNQLSRLEQQILDQELEYKKLKMESLTTEKKLNNSLKELKSVSDSINQKENKLLELDDVIEDQKSSLYIMIGLIVAISALFLLGAFAYIVKRKDNRRLANRTRSLQIAKDRLETARRKSEAANKTKTAFLSLMSHELRTPLQSIIGYTDLVLEELNAEGNTSYDDQLIRVSANGERLLELINNTLNLAKIEANKMIVQLSPTHINVLVNDAASNIKPLLEKNKNTLSINIDNHDFMPSIDYEKTLQIIVNLLSNATKFTKQGEINLAITNKKNILRISVSDTGIGLSDKQKKEVFKLYHQTNNNKPNPGTGLGLAITQYFCEIMGGSIMVEDNLSINENKKNLKGCKFTVEIPLPVIFISKTFLFENE